jgi:NAD+ kinase
MPASAARCPCPDRTAAASECDLIDNSDALISLGGDGTFLSTVHMCRFSAKPVLGINTGGLGFLTDIGPENLETNLSRLRAGDYAVVHRMVLEATLRRKGAVVQTLHALNDIFVNRYDRPKIISIAAWHGDTFITDFQGDGVVVATPSGSTAYSLAAGGPIVEPDVEAFLVTPLCPHSLTERPMILPSRRDIRLVIDPESSDVTLSADGLDSVRLHGGGSALHGAGRGRAKLRRTHSARARAGPAVLLPDEVGPACRPLGGVPL